MPCYLFTFHAYGSWMPNRKKGFVQRGKGIVPASDDMARNYRSNAKQEPISFDDEMQQLLIEEFRIACGCQQVRGHYMATDPTHVHVLTSWPDDRPWKRIRAGIRQSLSPRLNCELFSRTWFGEGASRKRVADQEHFEYLVTEYLPSHRGWKW